MRTRRVFFCRNRLAAKMTTMTSVHDDNVVAAAQELVARRGRAARQEAAERVAQFERLGATGPLARARPRRARPDGGRKPARPEAILISSVRATPQPVAGNSLKQAGIGAHPAPPSAAGKLPKPFPRAEIGFSLGPRPLPTAHSVRIPPASGCRAMAGRIKAPPSAPIG